MTEHTGPDAPHWYHFKECENDQWWFRWVRDGRAAVETGEHRFLILTRLVERDRTTDRVVTICYEPAENPDRPQEVGDTSEGRVPIYHGRGVDGIGRNNLLAARDSIEDGDEHVVVKRINGEVEMTETVPSALIAERASDVLMRQILEKEDIDGAALVYSTEEWERRQEIREAVEEADQQ